MFSAKVIGVCLFLVGSLNPISAGLLGTVQYYSAKVGLTCHGAPYTDGFIAVWERDINSPNDFLGISGYDENGWLSAEGSEKEIQQINPYVVIYHKCGHEELEPNCYWVERLPESNQDKIYVDPKDKIVDNFGILELYNYGETHEVTSSKKECDIEQVNWAVKERARTSTTRKPTTTTTQEPTTTEPPTTTKSTTTTPKPTTTEKPAVPTPKNGRRH